MATSIISHTTSDENTLVLDSTTVRWWCDVRCRQYLLKVLVILSWVQRLWTSTRANSTWPTTVVNKMAECDTAFNLVKKPHTTSSMWLCSGSLVASWYWCENCIAFSDHTHCAFIDSWSFALQNRATTNFVACRTTRWRTILPLLFPLAYSTVKKWDWLPLFNYKTPHTCS